MNKDSSKIKNSVMATHIDGTLEYWHATSQQLLFSKKVFFYFKFLSMINSCIVVKSVQMANIIHLEVKVDIYIWVH
jgi:hypothetical protein